MFAAKDTLLTRPSGGYNLTRSLRFRSSASAYLNRTFGSAGNRKTFTLSMWLKRGALSAASTPSIISATSNASTDDQSLRFTSADQLEFYYWNTTYQWRIITNNVLRDVAAWYHLVVKVDTTQAVAADRIRLYLNNVEVSYSSASYPAQNATLNFGNAQTHYLGSDISFGYLDAYFTEINFIDGQALTPSSFGAFSSYNQWLPKKYAGTYGTNGFYLPFTNNASTTTLGYDFSPQGNNWTTNNISVTSGSTYDSMTDVPTLTSATAANYCVWNPLDTSSNGTLSRANLQSTSVGFISGKGSIAVSNGKWYWEVTCTGGNYSGVGSHIGLDSVTSPCTSASSTRLGNTATSYSYNSWNGAKLNNSTSTAYGSTYTNGDVISVALDLNSGKIWWAKNGTWQASGDPAAGTNAAYSSIAAGLYTIAIGDDGGGGIVLDLNCGQQPFTYTPPTGYLALNTFNLSAGTVTTSGSFTGNASSDGPFVYLNGVPTAMTINGNAVTFGTNADKLSNGLKVRSSSSTYNASGSNTYSVSTAGAVFKNANAQGNP